MAYSPAGNLTSSPGLAHLQNVFIKRKALDRLQKKFRFREACMEDNIPARSGRTVQWFRYDNLAAITTPAEEGSVGTSQSFSSRVVSATVSEYSAFITVSTLLNETAPDPVLQSAGDLIGYQGGLSVDTITRNVIDADASSTNQNPIATYLTVKDIRASVHGLQGIDVEPFENGQFLVITSPYNSYDIVNDPAANGLADIFKYTNPDKADLVTRQDRGTVASVAGAKIIESTNVYSAGTPTLYRTYVFGKGGWARTSLEGSAPAMVTDPTRQGFNINVVRSAGPTPYDPAGELGGAVSFRFTYTACGLSGQAGIGGSFRSRTIDAASSIA
jgi:N4-gp56 family major capsid protein